MDWNPSFEQELQHIHTGRAQQQQPHDPEYGYHAQQTQSQQHYSSLSQNNFSIPYAPIVPFGLRLAAAISYVFGWATGFIFFLFAEKHNRFVRFHALQSFLFFGGIWASSMLYAVATTKCPSSAISSSNTSTSKQCQSNTSTNPVRV